MGTDLSSFAVLWGMLRVGQEEKPKNVTAYSESCGWLVAGDDQVEIGVSLGPTEQRVDQSIIGHG